MSYIGNQPTSVAFPYDTFSGTGSQTAFTMQLAPANTASVLVFVSGVKQDPSTYSVSGTTLTFSAAPPSGTSNISAIYLGIPASGVVNTAYRTVINFTATAGQTTFTPPSYTAGYIDVYRNGVKLALADFTATNGTTVVLASGATAGDVIETDSFYVSSVLNAIPATAGAVTNPYILSMDGSKLTGTQTIPWSTLPAGSVLQVVNATYSTQTSSTTATWADTGLTATITPRFATSKVLIIASQNGLNKWTNASNIGVRLLNGSTVLKVLENTAGYTGNSIANQVASAVISYLDSPATTSATIYKTQFNNGTPAGSVYIQDTSATSSITLMEIAG